MLWSDRQGDLPSTEPDPKDWSMSRAMAIGARFLPDDVQTGPAAAYVNESDFFVAPCHSVALKGATVEETYAEAGRRGEPGDCELLFGRNSAGRVAYMYIDLGTRPTLDWAEIEPLTSAEREYVDVIVGLYATVLKEGFVAIHYNIIVPGVPLEDVRSSLSTDTRFAAYSSAEGWLALPDAVAAIEPPERFATLHSDLLSAADALGDAGEDYTASIDSGSTERFASAIKAFAPAYETIEQAMDALIPLRLVESDE